MFCPKCGNEISDQAKFCPKCGASISGAGSGAPNGAASAAPPEPYQAWTETSTATATATATATEPKPKKKRKGAVILVAAALVVTVVFLLLMSSGSSEDPTKDNLPVRGETAETTPVSDETDEVDPALDQDASAQLLAIIDRTQNAHQEAFGALPDLNDDLDEDGMFRDGVTYADFVGHIRQWTQGLEEFLEDLMELWDEADEISGLDDKMESGKYEYFSMLYDAMAAYSETMAFYADFHEFLYEIINCRPLLSDSDDTEDYSGELSAWTQAALERYDAIFCPGSIMGEWAQYEEILEYNDSIVQKLDMAIQHGDMLRLFSTFYMENRFNVVELNQRLKFVHCLDNERDRADDQWNTADNLAEEIRAYAEMNEGEKEAYEFENLYWGTIYVDYEAVDVIYPSLYNTYDAFVIFKTGCVSGNRNIVVEAEIPGFTQKYQELFRLDSAYTAIYIKPPVLTGELDLSSAKSAQINITVSEQDGTLIDSKSFPVTLKSKYDFDWYSEDYGTSTQDDILCFLTPEASAVTQLKREAIDEITEMSGGAMESFVGYQQAVSNWNHYTITYLQAAGLMNALYEMGVRYNMDTFSLSGSNQRILLPEDVIENRSGLCIETSLVIASALQSANMHAFLIFPPGHAQVAVEIWNSGEGQGEYFLIETTALDSSINNKQHFIDNANQLLEYQGSTGIITYFDADGWADYLLNEVDYIVDCDDAQLLGLTQFTN